MKKQLLTALLLSVFISHAQNYQCLQPGVIHYFINGNGYLRGIRIDSTRMLGDTTVYYPFHTPRGSYGPGFPTALDSNGGSWLGKHVLQKSDGTFIFDSYWNDSVIIKTQANVGDSWTFYRDTSSLYYRATVVSLDTISFLSVSDSVKRIMINAYNGAAPVTSDPLDGFEIILSKNHGFVQVFDLFTFPYHKPDSSYRSGLDFFLDRSTLNNNNVNSIGGASPTAGITLFKLVDFINPNEQQLHNWNIGDTLLGYHGVGARVPGGMWYFGDYIFEKVTAKTISAHSTTYTLTGVNYTCGPRPGICSGWYSDPCSLIVNAGTFTYYDNVYRIANASFFPEENKPFRDYVFYFPEDNNYCVKGPAYTTTPSGRSIEDIPGPWYKLGIGITHDLDFDDNCLLVIDDHLAYTNIGGVPCGSRSALEVKQQATPVMQIDVYPNPATNTLTVSSLFSITAISISNVVGQIVYNRECNTEKVDINVADMPAGVYYVRINGSEVRRFVKE